MRCLPSSLVLVILATCQFDWPITPNKINNGYSPKQKALFWTVPPLWPTYIGERRTPFSKAYGIKWRGMEKMLGKILGTHWELERNIVRTYWEAEKNENISSPPPPPPAPKHKRKKSKAPWVHAWAFPLAAWNFCSQKTWLPFLAWANDLAKNTLPIQCWGTFDFYK
jgi:hypothetical protein